jgi:hypothetical protein
VEKLALCCNPASGGTFSSTAIDIINRLKLNLGKFEVAKAKMVLHLEALVRVGRGIPCTGNGLVVPSSSHKREVAGLIPAGCIITFISPIPLLPHRLISYFDVGRHLSIHENLHKTSQQQDNSLTRPRGEKKVLQLQSTGEERKEEINSTVQLVTCQYWYKL